MIKNKFSALIKKIKPAKKKVKRKKPAAIPFETEDKGKLFRAFSPTITQFCASPTQKIKSTKSKFIVNAILFAFIINLVVVLYGHLFITYLHDDGTVFLNLAVGDVSTSLVAAASDFVQNIINVLTKALQFVLPIYPLPHGYWIFLAPVLALLFFFMEVGILHLGILPQKPKGNIKTTLKIAAYSESSKFYFVFLFLYLGIAKIPNAIYAINPSWEEYGMYVISDDGYQSLFTYLTVLFIAIYLVTKLIIVTNGIISLHKLEEHEATFAAFWPLIFYVIMITIFVIVSGLFSPAEAPAAAATQIPPV